MKKQFILLATLACLSSQNFAFAQTDPRQDKDLIKKVDATLNAKTAAQQTQPVGKKEGLLSGEFMPEDLITKTFSTPSYTIQFLVENGDIYYILSADAAKEKNITVTEEERYVNGISSDPHAAVDVFAVIKGPGANEVNKIKLSTTEAFTLVRAIGCDSPRFPLDQATGVYPAKAASQWGKTYTNEITEKQHAVDCHDPFHCQCPLVTRRSSAINGLVLDNFNGWDNILNKEFKTNTYKVNVSIRETNGTKTGPIVFALNKTAANDNLIEVYTERVATPPQESDKVTYTFALVITEKSADGKIVISTNRFLVAKF